MHVLVSRRGGMSILAAGLVLLVVGQTPAQTPKAEPSRPEPPRFQVANEIHGKISELRDQPVAKVDRRIATLTMGSGTTMLVDLGRPEETKRLNLRDGDAITVSGPIARFVGQPVLLASKVKVRDQSVDIDRKFRDISGQVVGMAYTALRISESTGRGIEAFATSHLLALVTMKDGQSAWVDLGPGSSLTKLNLKPGDEIPARGAMAGFQNGDVLVAHNVQKGDHRVTIDWSREQRFLREPAGSPGR